METNCTVSLFNSGVRAARHVSLDDEPVPLPLKDRHVLDSFSFDSTLSPRGRHRYARHNAINAVLYVTETHIAWCVNSKCIITTLLDPLDPESNTSDLGTHFYCFYLTGVKSR